MTYAVSDVASLVTWLATVVTREQRVVLTREGGVVAILRGTSNQWRNNTTTQHLVEDCSPEPCFLSSLYACFPPMLGEDDHDVLEVRIMDKGSQPQRVSILLEGVPTMGVVDSGADITIMSKDLLSRVAAAAKLG